MVEYMKAINLITMLQCGHFAFDKATDWGATVVKR